MVGIDEIGKCHNVHGTGDDGVTPTGQFCLPPRGVGRTADKPLPGKTFQFGKLCKKYIFVI